MGRYYGEIVAVFIGAGLISWIFGDGPQMLCYAGATVSIMFIFWMVIVENVAESKKRGGAYWAEQPQNPPRGRRHERRDRRHERRDRQHEQDDRIQSADHGCREDYRRNVG